MISDLLQPPAFGPTQPLYPHLAQVVRVTGSTVGGNIYPAATSQYDSTLLAFRDREACYVHEPNGITLLIGYYDARLVGSYLGKPLYATTCCPTAASSSPAA